MMRGSPGIMHLTLDYYIEFNYKECVCSSHRSHSIFDKFKNPCDPVQPNEKNFHFVIYENTISHLRK